MEPSDTQFETASWLYSMTLAKSGDYEEPISYHYNASEEPLRHHALKGGDVASSDARSWASTPDQAAAHFQITKAPPPQHLYELSISPIARNLVGTWTYLDQPDFLPQGR